MLYSRYLLDISLVPGFLISSNCPSYHFFDILGYDLRILIQEAQTRWLKPPEVLFILQNHKDHQLTDKPPQRPSSKCLLSVYAPIFRIITQIFGKYMVLSTGGSLFLFNKRVLRFFRKDGHSWRRKRDGRTISEAHERLKV